MLGPTTRETNRVEVIIIEGSAASTKDKPASVTRDVGIRMYAVVTLHQRTNCFSMRFLVSARLFFFSSLGLSRPLKASDRNELEPEHADCCPDHYYDNCH